MQIITIIIIIIIIIIITYTLFTRKSSELFSKI